MHAQLQQVLISTKCTLIYSHSTEEWVRPHFFSFNQRHSLWKNTHCLPQPLPSTRWIRRSFVAWNQKRKCCLKWLLARVTHYHHTSVWVSNVPWWNEDCCRRYELAQSIYRTLLLRLGFKVNIGFPVWHMSNVYRKVEAYFILYFNMPHNHCEGKYLSGVGG